MGGRFTAVSRKFWQISSRQKANRIIPIIRRASERPKAESWHQEPQQKRQVPFRVQKGQWSRKRDGRRGLTARQLFAVVSLSQQLKETTAESTHQVSATQTHRRVTPRLKQKKALEDTTPPAKEGLIRSSRAALCSLGPLTWQWKGETPLAKTPIHTHWTEAICLASHHKPQTCICPPTGREADNGTWKSYSWVGQ